MTPILLVLTLNVETMLLLTRNYVVPQNTNARNALPNGETRTKLGMEYYQELIFHQYTTATLFVTYTRSSLLKCVLLARL